MPIFEYKCGDCGTTSEFLVGVAKESDDIACSSCGGSKLTKLFSAVNFATKGSAYVGACESCCGGHEQGATPRCEMGSPCPHN